MESDPSRPRVLTVLAAPETRFLVAAMLGGTCELRDAPPQDPLPVLRGWRPDLLLLDLELPEVSGLELTCRIRRDLLYRDLVIVGLGQASDGALPKVALVAGCTGFIPYPLEPSLFAGQIRGYLEGVRQELDLPEHLQYFRLFSEVLVEKLEQRLERLEQKTRALESERERRDDLTLQVLTSMAKLIEAKDPYTRGHSLRVTRYAMALGRRVGLGGEDLKVLERACQLHDIGKISIDIMHIHKRGPLTEEEWALIRQHPETGYAILSVIDFLQDEALVVRHHHVRFEKYGGLPQIPRRIRLMASIVAVADSFDAMTSQRSYNAPRPIPEALAELERCAGTQFDPELVAAFHAVAEREPGETAEEAVLPPTTPAAS